MSDPEIKGNGVTARSPCLPSSGRAARRSLERVSGPDPKGPGAASGRGVNVARPRHTYVAFPQQLDGRNRPDVNFTSPPSGAMSALNLDTDPAPAPRGNVSRQGGNDGVPHRTLVVDSVGYSVAHRNGTPPARGTQSQGLRPAETARLPNWASSQFSVPSLNYPQGGVPCCMGIRTNATPRKGPKG